MSWRLEFFIWLHCQLIMVEDWPYAGTNFMGDPDLPLPEGEEWEEELGMIFPCLLCIFCVPFFCQCMFWWQWYIYADVGPERPAGLSPTARRDQPAADPQARGAVGEELVQNLEGLTQGIPGYARLADVPFTYQRHTVGVPSRIHRLLRRLVRVVTCYHEHHHE